MYRSVLARAGIVHLLHGVAVELSDRLWRCAALAANVEMGATAGFLAVVSATDQTRRAFRCQKRPKWRNSDEDI
jgi:hypothetical protein